MALFQKSVQNDYLNRVQDSSIKEYWEYYDSYFNNPEKQKLIEQQKERKFYSEFIDELFVNCLGYTKKIGESQNYFIEEKNETDSGKNEGTLIMHTLGMTGGSLTHNLLYSSIETVNSIQEEIDDDF